MAPRTVCPSGKPCYNYSADSAAGPDLDGCVGLCARELFPAIDKIEERMAEKRMAPEEVRKQFLGEFPVPGPACQIPADAPHPWFVIGTDGRALTNVLRVDYLARPKIGGNFAQWQLPDGHVIHRIHERWDLAGKPRGTLFVFDPMWRGGERFKRTVDQAREMGFEIRTLLSYRDVAAAQGRQ